VTLTNRIGLDYRADGDQNWGPAHRNVRLMLDRLLCPSNVFFVSPEFTPENIHLSGTPDSRRHFNTIQGAVTAWEAGGFGDSTHGMILVLPGLYGENLSITKSVAIVAMHIDPTEVSGAHRGVLVAGGTGALASTVTVTPPAGESTRVLFSKISFRNQSPAQGSEVGGSTPMILKVADQGAGNYGASKNRVLLDQCNCVVDYNNNNDWAQGIQVGPHAWVGCYRSLFVWPGSLASRYVRWPFTIAANPTTERYGHLTLKGCEVRHPEFGDSPSNATIASNTGGTGLVVRSSFNRALGSRLISGTGVTGLASGEQAAQYLNILGLNVVEF